jgi:hypothetical protein
MQSVKYKQLFSFNNVSRFWLRQVYPCHYQCRKAVFNLSSPLSPGLYVWGIGGLFKTLCATRLEDIMAVIPIKKDIDKTNYVIHDAVTACCNSLDPHFPGYENGGIDSNMAAAIEKTVRAELLKRDLIRDIQ